METAPPGDEKQTLFKLLTLERLSIARELHDFPGQELTALRLVLHRLRKSFPSLNDPDRLAMLEEADSLANAAIRSMKEILEGKRKIYGEDLSTALGEVILEVEHLCGRSLGVVGLDSAPNCLEEQRLGELARIVREALLNAIRHSGEALLRLSYEHPEIQIEISGGPVEGVMEKVATGGNGLSGMAERAELIGAELLFCEDENGSLIFIIKLLVFT